MFKRANLNFCRKESLLNKKGKLEPQKTYNNDFFIKNCGKIWSIQKKAVLLQAFSRELRERETRRPRTPRRTRRPRKNYY